MTISKKDLLDALGKLSSTELKDAGLQKYDPASDATGKEAEEISQKKLEALRRELQMNLDLARMGDDRLKMEGDLNDLMTARLKHQAAISGAGDSEEAARLQAELDVMDNLIAAYQKRGIVAQEVTAADKRLGEVADGLIGKYATMSGVFTKATEGVAGSLFSFASKAKSADRPLNVLVKSLRKHVNVTTFANNITTKMIESTAMMVREFDNASASLAKATGMGDKFTGTLLQVRQEGNTVGVTFENAAAAIKALAEQFVGFSDQSARIRKDLIITTALLTRIGVSADETANLMNTFTLNMGMSATEATNFTKELIQMGSQADIASSKLIKDFHAAQKVIAVYGKNSVNVFKGLSAAAKAAGVEMGSLLALAGKFDTFESAAETVGKLNALLGTQMSSTEMLMMTEERRVETLIQQVQANGTNFKDMDRFQQKAIAAAAGISDMNEAQRVFGMNMKEYKKYNERMDRTANIQENFNKAIEATIPLGEAFSQLMAEFAVFVQPVLDKLTKVVVTVKDFIAGLSETKKAVIGTVAQMYLLYKAFALVPIIGPAVTGAMATAGAAIKGVGAASKIAGPSFSASLIEVGAAAAIGAKGLLVLGAATLMVGAGIGLAAYGMSLLVTSFAQLTGPQAGAILAFSGVIYLLVGAITALSLTAVMAGTAIIGMAILFTGIVAGLKEIKDVAEDSVALVNTLENLALITTGTSAQLMSGTAAAHVQGIKEAISAVYQQKIEIVLTIEEGEMIKNIKAKLKNDRDWAHAVVATGTG
jgi:hypothetical protein